MRDKEKDRKGIERDRKRYTKKLKKIRNRQNKTERK